ncbi:MAG: hypothetical protein IT464_12070 [Planctomycetes bacterium]|nr:hypothetical protein [Planctomycetota bacterium]
MAEPTARERTAYHEAGHAVMSWICGWPVMAVSIENEDGELGHTVRQVPDGFAVSSYASRGVWTDSEHFWRLMQTAMITLAGIQAEVLQFGGESEEYADWAESDMAEARAAIRQMCSQEDEIEETACLNYLAIRTRNQLGNRINSWPYVDALAKRLLKEPVLDVDHVEQVFEAVVEAQIELPPPGLAIPFYDGSSASSSES